MYRFHIYRASSREFPGREFPGNLRILASRFPGKNPRDPGNLNPLEKAHFDPNKQEIQVIAVTILPLVVTCKNDQH